MGLLAVILVVVATAALIAGYISRKHKKPVPVSVNYFFTRHCNYSCGYCYHVNKPDATSRQKLEDAKRGLRMLAEAGMKKLNFSGGEPFLYPKFLGELAKYCKTELHIESVSLVSNGSKVQRRWFEQYGQYLDMFAVSCDSFDKATNEQIGRLERDSTGGAKPAQLTQGDVAYRIRDLCEEFGVMFRLNTVVNAFNHSENLTEHVEALAPYRWKVFQCLDIDGENQGAGSLRDVAEFLVTDAQFDAFVKRHANVNPPPIEENNEVMRNSYWLLDEEMRFLDCSGGGKKPGPSLLEPGVTVAKATEHVRFDEGSFLRRDGVYWWSKDRVQQRMQEQEQEGATPQKQQTACESACAPDLQW